MRLRKVLINRIFLFAAGLCAGVVLGGMLREVMPRLACSVKDVRFGGPGGISLAGKIYRPRFSLKRRHDGILFCHGILPRGKDTGLYLELARGLAGRGYLVFTFDLAGFGKSDRMRGPVVSADPDYIMEIESALSYMLNELPIREDNVTIAGHSLGANLAFAVGSRDPKIKNIIVISAGNFKKAAGEKPHRESWLLKRFEKMTGLHVTEEAWLEMKKPLDVFQYLPLEREKNVLVIVAEREFGRIVEYNKRLYDELNAEKRFVVIPDSNHNFGFDMKEGNAVIDPAPARQLEECMAKWLSKIERSRKIGPGDAR